MTFWTSYGENTKDPKRNFRWKIDIGFMTKESQENIVWWAKKVTKPNYTIQESKHAYLNHTFYWPGRVEWQTVSLTLVDPVSPNAAALTNRIVQESGYVVPANADTLTTMSKGMAGAVLGGVTITQFASDGVTKVEEWTLKNPFIKSVKYGDLDYENDDLTQIEIELRYDWAECDVEEGGANSTGEFFHSE